MANSNRRQGIPPSEYEWNNIARRGEQAQTPGTRQDDEGGVMSAVAEKAGEFADSAAHVAGHARDKVQEWASSAAEMTSEAWSGFESVIRRNPLTSACVAMGLGVLIGMALSPSNFRSDYRHRL